jgi:acetate kinase
MPGAGGSPVLCLNMGSSSLKFALYRLGNTEESLLAAGEIERIGLSGGHLLVNGPDGRILQDQHRDFSDQKEAIGEIFAALDHLHLPVPCAAGHRIVHGGPDHTSPQRVDAALLKTLKKLSAFAPLHLPAEIAVVEAIAHHFPELPQVACFDTAFHRRMPEVARRLPLPGALWEKGVRHYGFHGLSYEYILDALGPAARGRVIIAHLGNGASMAAVFDGQPLDTTMGFTPTGGFMMGTRSGDLDPGVLLFLMREEGYDTSRIDRLVNHQAGLLGVSGISPDMKTLLERRKEEPSADLAIKMFCYQARKHIGAFAAALGGLDTLVFTGGMGENAPPVRFGICEGLHHLGITMDPEQNNRNAGIISEPSAPCMVRVMHTNEDLVIARHTRDLVMGRPGCVASTPE